jgi:antitoxin component YwqK of YwqJK toxin-antitoxin module
MSSKFTNKTNSLESNKASRRVNYDDLEFDDQQALLDGIPFTGLVFSVYQGGALESERLYRDGLPEGLQQSFYLDGSLKKKSFAVWSRGSTEVFEYYQNGVLKSYRRYVDQISVEEKAWNPDGTPSPT